MERKCAVAHSEQKQNAPHEMMNVPPIHDDPTKGAYVVSDGHHQQTDAYKSDEETHRSEKEPTPWPVWNALMHEKAKLGEVKEQQHGCCRQKGKYKKNPGAGKVHSNKDTFR
jgi:hypothetical protein